MEHTKVEITSIQQTIDEATDAQLHELSDLQLAFVGGGIGDAVFA
jgi:hypothetical protein